MRLLLRSVIIDEAELLSGARQFDRATLAQIYDQFSPGLYRYAARRLGDAIQAEECVAETFSRFLQVLRDGKGPRDHLRAYLYRVANNWIVDSYRRQPPPPLPLEPEFAAAIQDGPAARLSEEIEREEMRSALKQLTPEQQQVIVLKYLEGWKAEEIANTLEKPVGAVKALQHRGLAALRRLMAKEA